LYRGYGIRLLRLQPELIGGQSGPSKSDMCISIPRQPTKFDLVINLKGARADRAAGAAGNRRRGDRVATPFAGIAYGRSL
jgi:hypothetical protein